MNNDWQLLLKRTPGGNLRGNFYNVYIVLMNHPQWKSVIGLNQYGGHEIAKPPPWGGKGYRWWTDHDYLRAVVWLEQSFFSGGVPVYVVKRVIDLIGDNSHLNS